MEKLIHNIAPIYNRYSKILILGSFPSRKSREHCFYYAHPQNQFWQILSDVFSEKIENKKQFLLKHNIALWDVVASCEIKGSNDATIKNITVNDINSLVKKTNIKVIYTTGKKAFNLYKKYLEVEIGIKAIYLPSTSPCYKKMSYNEKLIQYKQIKKIR